jgi:hypothetical protein
MIKWIDRRSVLTQGRKKYVFGDTIPEGILSAERLDLLVSQKKIKVESETPKPAPVVQRPNLMTPPNTGPGSSPKPKFKPESKPEPEPEAEENPELSYEDDEA